MTTAPVKAGRSRLGAEAEEEVDNLGFQGRVESINHWQETSVGRRIVDSPVR